MRSSALAACVLATILLAGCGSGSSGPRLPDRELQKLVLQNEDLPAYDRFAFGREVISELNPVLDRDPNKFGRQNGWTARYRRARGRAGALTVASIVDVFGRGKDARAFLDAVRENQAQLAPGNGLKEIDVTGLGDEATAVASANPPPDAIRSVQISWRQGRFAASLAASGFARAMTVEDVLELARKQERRLR